MSLSLTGIGLMSGTSADGIDAALVKLTQEATLEVRVLAFERLDYDPQFKQKILASFNSYQADRLCELNFELGEKLAQAVNLLKEKTDMPIDFVASHGQTIYHIPPQNGRIPSTLQLGEPCVIAERTGLTVVADFRPRDMASGGQGAPLVALADYLLFNNLGGAISQNIGGIANMTLIPADKDINKVIAFDTGPGNMIIDEIIRTLTKGKEEYDLFGQRAKLGQVNPELLEKLLSENYYKLKPPKTTGRELFGQEYTQNLIKAAKELGIKDDDLIATATALTVESIARAYEEFILPNNKVSIVIVGGGGSYNLTLMKWLKKRLPALSIKTHEDFGISSDAKEAVAFSILGFRTLVNQTGNVPRATGAEKEAVLGKIIPGDNYHELLPKIYPRIIK